MGAHHGFPAETGETDGGDDTADGLGDLSYAAVVLVAFGAAFLGLLLGVRRWRETGTRRSVFWRHYPQVFTLRPRRPTLPSLQVFRL